MRILGIETATRRGSVALVEGDRLIASDAHQELNAHGERILPMIEQLMAEAGWARGDLARIGVGVGPGSFTGLRIGLALAQGLGLALRIPVIGVPALKAMALAAPTDQPDARCALLDARRDEVFAAAYDADGRELLEAQALPRAEALAELAKRVAGPRLLLGQVASELVAELGGEPNEPTGLRVYRSPETDLPHAHQVALAARLLSEHEAPPHPKYVREPDAIKPSLPPSPLG